MRLIIDSLIAMMLVVILAGVILHHRQKQRLAAQYQQTFADLSMLRETLLYHAAIEHAASNEQGHLSHISPEWFPQGLPMNAMIPGRHPWIDIAPPGDQSSHPPDPIVTRQTQAGYWYNPNRGILRARVPRLFTEHATLNLYNQINSTALLAFPQSQSHNQPLPHPVLTTQFADSTTPRKRTLRDTPTTPWTDDFDLDDLVVTSQAPDHPAKADTQPPPPATPSAKPTSPLPAQSTQPTSRPTLRDAK